MLYDFIEYEHRLAQKQVLSLESTDGTLIVCCEGGLWITEENGEDVWLQAGDSYQPRGMGRLVIEALRAARLQFRPVQRQEAKIVLRSSAASFMHPMRQIGQLFHRQFGQLIGRSNAWSQGHRKASAARAGCECA